ncbi:rhodanese-like domain-containing protein [Defluviimonas sp. SAOS-178_SWC]|uniref:rhodanese-like domain-containing protein n=1 Tax=Defluviimonas sp. SAOS-178_SWC TaxID=3121287 RepID=UPI003221AE12
MLSFLKPSAARFSAAEAVAKVEAGEMVLIDVRDRTELAASGRAAGALHVPLMMLKMKCDPSSPECLAELSEGKPLAVYCASGGRSQMAAQMLNAMGHREVHNIGGFYDWHAAGGAVESV